MNRVGRYRKLSGVRAFSDKMMNAFAFAVQQPVYCGQVSRRDRSCATNDLDFDEATRLSPGGHSSRRSEEMLAIAHLDGGGSTPVRRK